MATPTDEPGPLPSMVGNLWVPVWAIRPGSYAALAPLADTMPLWLLLHSYNADAWRPCYWTREQLGATLGMGRRKVSRQLARLRKAYLLLEVDRGLDRKTHRQRAFARWALDPFAAEIWRPKVELVLATIAEEDGQDGRWHHNALQTLDGLERRSRALANRISEDMPFTPRARKRKRRKDRNQGPGSKMDPWVQNGPRGEGFYQGGGNEAFRAAYPTLPHGKRAKK